MSTLSFDAQDGAMVEPMGMDVTVNLNELMGQSWIDTEYREPVYGYSYASSSSSFSCGSLTSGYLTPKSSTSASPSRRHSLASAIKPVPIFGSSVAQHQRFPTPRTPLKYQDLYSSQAIGTQSTYTCSTPTSRGLEDNFAMDTEESSLSGKLHIALGLSTPTGIDGSSFPRYRDEEVISPHTIFGDENGLLSPTPLNNQYEDYTFDRRPYGDYPATCAHNSIIEPEPATLPETIAPAQTTYKTESTPPPMLGDPFVSPVKPSFDISPFGESSNLLDQAKGSAYLSDTLSTPKTLGLNGSGRSFTSMSSDSEDDEACSIFPHGIACPRPRRKYIRTQISSTSRDLQSKRTQRPIPVKREPGSQHRCPFCRERACFKRPEHLTRHVLSKHGEGEIFICKVPKCECKIKGRPDNMDAHYRKTHMYGIEKQKGKKNIFVSIEWARELGLDGIDERVNPRQPKGKKDLWAIPDGKGEGGR
jgi:hypothetical protein